MVKKLKTSTKDVNRAGVTTVSTLASRFEDTARKLWDAGAGAYSTVQNTRSEAVDRVTQEVKALRLNARKRVKRTVGNVKHRVVTTRGRIEKQIQDGVAVPLEFFGIPTQKDVDRLARRVSELTVAVKQLANENAVRPVSNVANAANAPNPRAA